MLLIKKLTIQDLKNHSMIEDFNYSLGNDDKVGIIGEEGNGKSTLLKAIKNQKSIEHYTVISGTIDTDFKHIAYFEQQIDAAWNESLIFEYLLKQTVDDSIEAEQYNELLAYEKLCQKLFLAGDFIQRDQSIQTLSGGEKVKLQLLKLMHQPMDLLLLDEPTNDLDIETLEWLEQFLKGLSIPVMFISHDETLLERVATTILHLEQLNKKTKCKATVFKGNYREYRSQRSSGLAKEQQLAQKEKQEYIKKKIKLNDQRNAVHDALNDTVRNPGLAAKLKRKMGNIKAQERRFETEGYAHVDSVEEAIAIYFEKTTLPAQKIIVSYEQEELRIQDTLLVRDINLHVYGRDKVVITGRNGCGKSILLKAIYQQLSQRNDIRLCYMPQNYAELFAPSDTPITFLLTKGDQQDVTIARELLGRMKFTRDEMEHSVFALSEGQKAKLYLIRAIKVRCNVLLLDEPTRNLSPLTGPVIRDILQAFDGCILAVSHDRCLIDEVFTKRYEIVHQQLVLYAAHSQ